MLDKLRGSVRPVLAYLFSGAFIALVIAAFFMFGTAELGEKVVISFLPIAALIAGLYFQSRNKKE